MNKKKSKSLPLSHNISKIEKMVDEIILKNKEKLEKISSDGIDVEKFSLKNKEGNIIYYLKKDYKKKIDDLEIFSDKIIAEARSNLGEEPLKPADKEEQPFITEDSFKEPEVISKNKRYKRRIKFRKREKKPASVNYKTAAQEEDDRLKSEELEKVASDIEKIQEIKINQETKEEAEIVDEKIKQTSQDEKEIQEKDLTEDKAIELAKKHTVFRKKTIFPPMKEKKDDDQWSSYSEETLNELKNSNIDGINVPKEKETDIDKPTSDEAKLIDEKIKNASEGDKSEEQIEKAKSKGFDLAKEHIDKISAKNVEEPIIKQQKLPDSTKSLVTSLKEEDKEREHVFFDEDDSSHGWSPRVSEKEKKEKHSLNSGKPEIWSDDGDKDADIELPAEVLSVKSGKLSDLGFSENEWEELVFYPIHEPFAYVEILREKETFEKCYVLVEVKLKEKEEEMLDFISDTMKGLNIDTEELESKGDNKYLLDRVNQIISEYNIEVDDKSLNGILYYFGKSSLGLGKIDPIMMDPNIEDISCDGAGVPIFLYHRQYGSLKSNIMFDDEEELSGFIHKLAEKCGKHISIAEPMIDATMPDGSRIQITLSDEVTTRGSTFTIRKFRADPFSPPDLVEFNTMSSEMIAFMWLAVENGINTLFAGGTASGKTTTLNAVSLFIPRESKIVSIEETREINLPHPNWIPGVARAGFGEVVADKVVGEINLYDLMKAALRQRPEYILVGEIRGREAYVLFQAMATGHATYSTVHADSAQSLIHRLEGKPINIPRVMLQSLDIVCLHILTHVKNKRVRRCKQIIEIIDIDPSTKEILTNEVFRWEPVEDTFVYLGKSFVLERIRAEKDLTREGITMELKNRKNIIEWMNKNNVREFKEVAQIVSQYIENNEETLKLIKEDDK